MTSRLQKIIILISFCLALCFSCESESDIDPITEILTDKKWVLSKQVQYSYLNSVLDTIRLSSYNETFLFLTSGELEVGQNEYILNSEWWLNNDKSIIKTKLHEQNFLESSFPIIKLSRDSLILVSMDYTVLARRDWRNINTIIDTLHHVNYKHYSIEKYN